MLWKSAHSFPPPVPRNLDENIHQIYISEFSVKNIDVLLHL